MYYRMYFYFEHGNAGVGIEHYKGQDVLEFWSLYYPTTDTYKILSDVLHNHIKVDPDKYYCIRNGRGIAKESLAKLRDEFPFVKFRSIENITLLKDVKELCYDALERTTNVSERLIDDEPTL